MYNPYGGKHPLPSIWSDEEMILLQKLVETDKIKWKLIARRLNRSYNSVYKKYYKLKKCMK